VKLSGLQKVIWVLAGAAALVFIWLLLWSDYRADRARTESETPFFADFELTDHRGMVQTDEDFAGRWMLVFFGFTNCPDVCPTTLSEVAAVMEGLGGEAAKVQPIFITIDPERDSPAELAEYVPLFDAGIIGLTGTPEQISETSETFPIFYERIQEAAAPDGYTMGHTSHLFLFDTQAGFAESWSYGTPAEEILDDLRERI
jgi:protein SCO1/2